jgi:hypothetical protein
MPGYEALYEALEFLCEMLLFQMCGNVKIGLVHMALELGETMIGFLGGSTRYGFIYQFALAMMDDIFMIPCFILSIILFLTEVSNSCLLLALSACLGLGKSLCNLVYYVNSLCQ